MIEQIGSNEKITKPDLVSLIEDRWDVGQLEVSQSTIKKILDAALDEIIKHLTMGVNKSVHLRGFGVFSTTEGKRNIRKMQFLPCEGINAKIRENYDNEKSYL